MTAGNSKILSAEMLASNDPSKLFQLVMAEYRRSNEERKISLIGELVAEVTALRQFG